MENFVLFWSSIGLSALIYLYSLYLLIHIDSADKLFKVLIFFNTGVVGIFISIFTKLNFESHHQALYSTEEVLRNPNASQQNFS